MNYLHYLMKEAYVMNEKSIVFIGFMGVGKTTIGELVAKKLHRDFIDIDQEIEKEYKMPTTEIFETFGEKVFREKEKQVIEHFSKQKSKIISVGGGAFLQEEIRNICLENCTVIFLDLSFDLWKERISLIIESRPVLQGKSIEEIKELFENRQKIYSAHHLKVSTDNKHEEEVADYIIQYLSKESE